MLSFRWSYLQSRNRDTHIEMYRCLGFPGGLVGKESTWSAGDSREVASIPGWGISPRVGNGILTSIPAWKIPGTEELGGLQFMGSQGVRHDWAIECTHTHTPWFLGIWTPAGTYINGSPGSQAFGFGLKLQHWLSLQTANHGTSQPLKSCELMSQNKSFYFIYI